MPLTPGTRFGHYEILAPLGAGGMGEVYRARDTRLDRDIAIKVLSPELATSAHGLTRFEQEARSASALNHPNIVAVYDVGELDGAAYIVMELVEGRTLREVLAAGAVPMKKGLQIATQIAEGLARAHAAGIVHRDLKPENVIVTRDGLVKILDFGLAKLTPAAAGDGSLFRTVAAPATNPGTILGTVGYMAPEQVRGDTVDFRADQFALGCLLYELATGKRPFQRETSAQTLAAIIEDEPPAFGELSPHAPTPLRWIIERCLAKDPEDRYGSTRDLARDLQSVRDHLSEAPSLAGTVVAAPAARGRVRALRPMAWLGVGAAVGAALAIWATHAPAPEPPSFRPLTFSGRDTAPAMSADGRLVAFQSERDGISRIWLKQLAGGGEAPLTAGNDAEPRFSPDGSAILFLHAEANGPSAVYRVPILGGQPRRLIDDAAGADSSPDGERIAFVRYVQSGATIDSVIGTASSDGTGVQEIRTVRNVVLRTPRWSPDARWIAFNARSFGVAQGPGGIHLISADGREEQVVNPPSHGGDLSSPVWSAERDLVYSQAEAVTSVGVLANSATRILAHRPESNSARVLFWLPFRTQTLDIMAPGRIVLDVQNAHENLRELQAGASRTAAEESWLTRGSSVDRQPIYSPDGEWVMFTSNRSGNLDLWAVSRKTGGVRRVTDHPGEDWDPAYVHNGSGIVWSSNRSGNFEIWMADPDGGRARQVSSDGVDAENPTATTDGGWIVYNSGNPAKRGLWKVRADGTQSTQLLAGTFAWPEVSPDGQFAVYTSLDPRVRVVRVVRVVDGAQVPFEIRTAPNAGGRTRWMPDGRVIAFLDTDARGRNTVFTQEFAPGRDTTVTRRSLGSLDIDGDIETFGVSPDAGRVTVAVVEDFWSLMTVDGLAGVSPAKR